VADLESETAMARINHRLSPELETLFMPAASGKEEISAGELAALQNTIPYEILCALSKRVTRVYIKNGQEDSVFDCILD